MPKPGAPISHDAIKRSLKSKFKLILSENRILLETINGYVKRAEKVYKEMEDSDDVTPKQFSKAMKKLERAYSACVGLILVASDLFEKGDSEILKNRDLGLASSCGSETSVFSSESSGTITDANHTRKVPNEKALHRRSRSSDVWQLHDGGRVRSKPQPASRKCRVADVAETPGVEASNMSESERLFVHLGVNSDVDQIELQRFLHGLENEKHQTDHPNPCAAKEKQLLSYKMQREKDCTDGKEDGDGKEPIEDPVPHSLPQRLKVLKSALENFLDRSIGDELYAQALSDIRELVLKNNESKESLGFKDLQPECDSKDGYNMQVSPSPMSDSLSTDNHHKMGQLGSHLCEDQDDLKSSYGNALKQGPADAQHGNKQKEGSGILVRTPQAAGEAKSQTYNLDLAEKTLLTHTHQLQQARHDQLRAMQQVPSSQQWQVNQHTVQSSPARSPPRAPIGEQEDISQIIVNRIVDMVSAKLVPRLQKSGGEDGGIFSQHPPGRAAESNERDELSRAVESVNSPPQLACNCFPHALQQGNFCGNCGQIPKYRLYYESGHYQRELQKLQRRTNRPKMVSFEEDFDSTSQCNACDSRYTCDSRQLDTSPSRKTRPCTYKEGEAEQQQNYTSQSGSRFSSLHKKRMYNMPQRSTNQQQQHLPIRRILRSEDVFVAEHEANVDKDEESERAQVSDQEVMSDQQLQTPQQQDMHSKTVPGHESLPWVKRPDPKSPSLFETREYRGIHQMQRGATTQHQIAAQRNDSFIQNLKPDIQQVSQAASQEREWFSSPNLPSESGSIERNKTCPSEGNTVTRFPYRLLESAPNDQTPEDFSDGQVSASEHGSPNSEWLQNQLSQTSVTAHSQQPAEGPRSCPSRLPRSTQAQLRGVGYSSSLSFKTTFGKTNTYELVHQTSVSSCEGSPAFSGDDKLYGDNTTSNHDDSDGMESKPQRPEVVCIDTMQLHADASRTITLSNLPLDINKKELLTIFEKYGHVTKIYYIQDRNTGLFQGRAYGKFSKASEAFQAVQDLQELTIDGHEICVQLCVNTQ